MRGDRRVHTHFRKRRKAKRKVLSYGLPREIPHEDYVDGNVIYSDGSFGRMYRLSPVFIDSLDELEQENYASAVAAAVAVQGCDIQFVWRKKADLPLLDGNRDLSDPVLYLMAEDRKKMFLEMAQKEELFSVSAEMWIRKKYPRAVPGSLSAFVEMDEEKAMQRYLQEHNALSADFSILCDSVVSPLSGISSRASLRRRSRIFPVGLLRRRQGLPRVEVREADTLPFCRDGRGTALGIHGRRQQKRTPDLRAVSGRHTFLQLCVHDQPPAVHSDGDDCRRKCPRPSDGQSERRPEKALQEIYVRHHRQRPGDAGAGCRSGRAASGT